MFEGGTVWGRAGGTFCIIFFIFDWFYKVLNAIHCISLGFVAFSICLLVFLDVSIVFAAFAVFAGFQKD